MTIQMRELMLNIASLKVSRFYDNKNQRFSNNIAKFPFSCDTMVELCNRYSCELICQLFLKVKTITRPTSKQLQLLQQKN